MRGMLGYGKKVTEQRALTSWRMHREGEGLVRLQKQSNQVMGTYFLETIEGQTYQDMDRK